MYGGVRINLAGREPDGVVQPNEVDALVAEITEGLLEIRNLDTGGRVIRGVERCDRWHRRSAQDVMPDLFLDWERSHLIENVASPRIGELRKRYQGWRTGDHRPAGMLVAHGSGLPSGVRMESLAPEDIGPSLAAVLRVDVPQVDGSASPWLARLGATSSTFA